MSSNVKRLKAAAVAASAGAALMATAGLSQAEDIKLRIASGHATATPYVNVLTTFFVPEVTKRVAAKTRHKLELDLPRFRGQLRFWD